MCEAAALCSNASSGLSIAECIDSDMTQRLSLAAGKVFPFDQYKEAIRESTRAGRGAKVFLG